MLLPGNKRNSSAILIRLDFGDDKWVSGDAAAKNAFLNLVFAHEVAHFSPQYAQDPADGRKTGPVVDRVNEIQQALGLPLRAEYSANRRAGENFWVDVSFGKAQADKAGNIVRKNGGIVVNTTNQVVTWLKRNVGGTGVN